MPTPLCPRLVSVLAPPLVLVPSFSLIPRRLPSAPSKEPFSKRQYIFLQCLATIHTTRASPPNALNAARAPEQVLTEQPEPIGSPNIAGPSGTFDAADVSLYKVSCRYYVTQ